MVLAREPAQRAPQAVRPSIVPFPRPESVPRPPVWARPDPGYALPTISIITPSLDQNQFLEQAMLSTIEQAYPNLEYVVVDGGSTDGSIDTIQRYEDDLTDWVSESDAGPYEAINKGFARTRGEIMGWINGDDKYMPWALRVVGEIFASHPEVEWITSRYPLTLAATGEPVRCAERIGYSRAEFLQGANLDGRNGWIQQESTFWRRSLWERAGSRLDTSLRFAADFELWARFFEHAELYCVDTPLGSFRMHSAQRSALHYDEYLHEAESVLQRYGGRRPGAFEDKMRARVHRYLPLRFRRRLGIAHPCIVHNADGEWEISSI